MSAPTRGHLRLVHSAPADVIPLPRTPMRYDVLLHQALRTIPQEAITRHRMHVTVTGQDAPLWLRATLPKAVGLGLVAWRPCGDQTYLATLTATGARQLDAWDRDHPARPSHDGGGDAA